jgi:hypothetical protein
MVIAGISFFFFRFVRQATGSVAEYIVMRTILITNHALSVRCHFQIGIRVKGPDRLNSPARLASLARTFIHLDCGRQSPLSSFIQFDRRLSQSRWIKLDKGG